MEKLREGFKKGKSISEEEFNKVVKKFKPPNVNNSDLTYFDEILTLRNKIIELEKEVDEIIERERKFFKERYDNLKLINPKHGFQYDLIYAAMFGNGIVI